jgi:hypothetical protein
MRLLLFFAVPLFAQTPCADMARLPDVTAAEQTATHCRVSITLRPSADSEIKSEVWLPPAAAWNGKFLMEGGGGFVGSVNTRGMTNAVREGYATASTDTGHTGGSGSFALGHPEKIVVPGFFLPARCISLWAAWLASLRPACLASSPSQFRTETTCRLHSKQSKKRTV